MGVQYAKMHNLAKGKASRLLKWVAPPTALQKGTRFQNDRLQEKNKQLRGHRAEMERQLDAMMSVVPTGTSRCRTPTLFSRVSNKYCTGGGKGQVS